MEASKITDEETINPLTSPGEVVTLFTYLYLSAGAPAEGKVKGLMLLICNQCFNIVMN